VKASGGHEPTLRIVSAMTAVLAGYDGFCSAHEPDVVATAVNLFYEAATQQVYKHDGTLIGYRGGSLSAIWKAPHDQDEYALSAARAASEIAVLDGPFGGMLVTVGVATGFVMVGILGSSLRRAYMAVGKPMTDSERLSALAGPGEAYIDETTWEGARGQIESAAVVGLRGLGGVSVKDTVYRLLEGSSR
jgi:adenylate cyclase